MTVFEKSNPALYKKNVSSKIALHFLHSGFFMNQSLG